MVAPVAVVGVGGAMGDATVVDMAAWDRDFRINLTSMVLMARHAIPEMRKVGGGVIVNMSSVSGCKCLIRITWTQALRAVLYTN